MWRRRRSRYSSAHELEWLVVGLGNPGRRYANTPHNVGFAVVEGLAASHRIPLVAKHDGLYGVGAIGGTDVALLLPLTFMNLSGRSVKPALRALSLAPDRLLVVHDEIDLDFARLQLKSGGGLAGHNGLRSISDLLGTRDFHRLRVGIGRPRAGDRRPIHDWILAPWYDDLDVEPVVADAGSVVELVVERGLREVMDQVNART